MWGSLGWLRTSGAILFGLVSWFLFAPAAVGGPATYLVTRGISMEPGIVAGDLVIVRQADRYVVGDAVAYYSDQLRVVAFHRIVTISQEGRYSFKGDNNSWIDPDHPTAGAIFGKEWIHIPRGGIWLNRIANPVNLAALVFLLLIASSAAEAKNGRRSHRRRRMPDESSGKAVFAPWWTTLAPATRTLFTASAAAATIGLLLTLFTFTRPTTVSATTTSGGSGSGATVIFSYSAEVTPSAAYQNSQVKSPTPIFRSQLNDVKVNYAYQGQPGTISTIARLSTGSGWTWDLALAEPQTFDANDFAGAVTLDFDEIDRIVARGAKATGIPTDSVTIAVIPTIQTDQGTWAPKLDLNLGPQTMTLAGDEASLTVKQEAATDSTTTTSLVPNKIFGIPVLLARLGSALLLIGGLIGLGIAYLNSRRQPPIRESEMIRLQYGSLIVPVSEPPTIKGMVIDVPDIDSLAKLAQRYVLLILMAHVNGMDVFIVQDEDVAYRYVSRPAAPPQPYVDPGAGVGLFQ
jgi:signal peptidase I